METIQIFERGKRPQIKASIDVFNNMLDIKDVEKELFVVFYLDTRNKIISREIISIGNLNTSVVHPREVFRNAILRNCNSIIISHNHPSGDSTPSREDIQVTNMLYKASKIIGICLLDHIIVGDDYYSMSDHGDLIRTDDLDSD